MNVATTSLVRFAPHSAVGVLLMVVLWTPPAAVVAQEPIAARITISQSPGGPGQDVSVPIFLVTADGVRVGAISLRITFPTARATFKQATSDHHMVSGVDANGDDRAMSVLTLDIDGGEGKTNLADGQIADLTFQISKDAKLEEYITLAGTAVVRTPDQPAAEITPVRVYEGLIMVTGERIFSCFFYMH